MPTVTTRLASLGISLPSPPKPVASYVPVVRVAGGSVVMISGQIPMRDGRLIATGAVPSAVNLETARECARQCVLNGLASLAAEVGSLERVRRIIRLGVFVACDPGFIDHPKVANGASDLLVELFGESGRHARAAVGAPSLPLGAPVEVEMMVMVD